jgi:hypothetical protein
MRKMLLLVPAVIIAAACGNTDADAVREESPRDVFWANLQSICGRAYGGELVDVTPGDTVFTGRTLVMHVRQCSDDEVGIPFHVGDDHSRTWVISRIDGGLRLKHDHRHEDGTEDEVTQYGGDTRGAGTATRQEFHADEHTVSVVPEAVTNVWTVEIEPGRVFAYVLRREGTERRVRVEFDLTREVPHPPTPWGH